MKTKYLFTAFAASCLSLAALPAIAQEMTYPEKCKGMTWQKWACRQAAG